MSAKSVAKSTLQRVLGRGLGNEARKLVDSAKVVSFDMFDTLVVRDCPDPSFVFDIVERRYNRRHADAPIEGFKRSRMQAEASARGIVPSGEPVVWDIYALLGDGHEGIAPELLALELDTECRLCRADPVAKELFDYAIASGKRVVVASDMYLDEASIRLILESCGYAGFEKVYVSSAVGASKRSGGMFFALQRETGVDPRDIVHIGDHPISDWIVPRRMGVRSFLYRRKGARLHLFDDWPSQGWVGDPVESGVLGSVLENGIADYADDACSWMGYAVLGPLLLGYSIWLQDLYKAEGCSSIWFLSREGDLLKQAAERLCATSDEFKYLYVSRTALCRACAGATKDYSELIDVFSTLVSGVKTVGDLLEILGVEIDEAALADRGIAAADAFADASPDGLFDLVMQHGHAFFANQHELAEEYLRGACGGDPGGRILVSDIGWCATMQALLHRILPEAEFVGAYLAVSDLQDGRSRLLDRVALDRRGYWCDASGWQTDGQAIRFTISAMETMFLSDEGTTVGYERVDGDARPRNDEASISFDTSVATGLLQDAAMAFVGECVDRGICDLLGGIDRVSAMLPYLNTVVRSKRRATEFLSHFTFVDGVKHVEFLPKHRLPYYLVHPRKVIRELDLSGSKLIWLRGLLKLPLPYYRILRVLTSGLGMESDYVRMLERGEA